MNYQYKISKPNEEINKVFTLIAQLTGLSHPVQGLPYASILETIRLP